MSGLTDYHALHMAHELTRRHASDSTEKLAGIVAGAQVDLNPHRIEAALFDTHDGVDRRPETLLDDVSAKLTHRADVRALFTIHRSVK